MKTVLIVAATEGELSGVRSFIQGLDVVMDAAYRFETLVSGVGMMIATFSITQYLLQHNVDYVIQIGIAGSFSRKIMIGDVVQVVSEALGDFGAEDVQNDLDIFEMNLMNENVFPFDNKLLFEPELLPELLAVDLPKVHSITVNMTSGRNNTIQKRRKKYAAQIETMEGAALHYVCLQLGKPFIQIRSISNYVTERDTSQWQIQKAMQNLNHWLIHNILNK